MNLTSPELPRAHIYGSFSVFLLLLIVQWVLFWYMPWSKRYSADEKIYVAKALSIITGEQPKRFLNSHHPYGYPFLIALCNFFDPNFKGIRQRIAPLQFFLISATLVCFQILATRAVGSSWRLYLVAILLGIQPWTFAYARTMYSDSIAASLTTFGLLSLALFIVRDRKAAIWLFISFVIFALLILFRIEMVLVVPVFLLIAVWLKYLKSYSLKFPLLILFLFLAVFVIFANYSLATKGKIGKYKIVKSGAYQWVGTWFATERTGFKRFLYGSLTLAELEALPDYAFSDPIERKEIRSAVQQLEMKKRYDREADKTFRKIALKRIKENPVFHYLLPKLWGCIHIWVNFDLNEQIWTLRQNNFLFAVIVGGFAILKVVIFLLAAFSVYYLIRRKRDGSIQWYDYVTILMFVCVLTRTLLIGGTVGWIHRYALPAWPAMMWCAISALFDRRVTLQLTR